MTSQQLYDNAFRLIRVLGALNEGASWDNDDKVADLDYEFFSGRVANFDILNESYFAKDLVEVEQRYGLSVSHLNYDVSISGGLRYDEVGFGTRLFLKAIVFYAGSKSTLDYIDISRELEQDEMLTFAKATYKSVHTTYRTIFGNQAHYSVCLIDQVDDMVLRYDIHVKYKDENGEYAGKAMPSSYRELNLITLNDLYNVGTLKHSELAITGLEI